MNYLLLFLLVLFLLFVVLFICIAYDYFTKKPIPHKPHVFNNLY